MRSNGKIVALAVLLAVLTIGVGYAAINTVTLVVSGSATAAPNQTNFKVEFFGNAQSSDASKLTVGIDASNKTKATMTATGLTAKGDSVTATYTVKNLSGDLSASLAASVAENTNDEYFKVEPTVTQGIITAGSTTTVTVKITLLKTPVSDDETSNITVNLVATPLQPVA